MANREHDDERHARAFFTMITGQVVLHADVNGGVDYRSPDGSMAVEVTTVTDRRAKAARRHIDDLVGSWVTHPLLGSCWLVSVNDRHPRLKGLPARVLPHLATLDHAGIRSVWRRSAYAFVSQPAHVQAAVQGLVNNGIEFASAPPELCRGDDHDHTVRWLVGGGGVARDSDSALARIEADLNAHPDNFRKLLAAGADEMHLFVWIDAETPFSITRAFTAHTGAAEPEFGLPTRPPALDGNVDYLWVVHRGTEAGWQWNGDRWRHVRRREASPSGDAEPDTLS